MGERHLKSEEAWFGANPAPARIVTMKVNKEIAPDLRTRGDLIAIVDSAADYLASRDTDPGSEVKVIWHLSPDPQGNPKIRLLLKDEAYSTDRSYSPSQLESPDLRELRLVSVWNDFLRARSHWDAARVNRLINQADGE